MSTDSEAREHYSPYIPGSNKPLRYNNIEDLEEAFQNPGDKIVAFLVEPIRGEAGIVVPESDYLSKVSAICKKYNVLLICDEI